MRFFVDAGMSGDDFVFMRAVFVHLGFGPDNTSYARRVVQGLSAELVRYVPDRALLRSVNFSVIGFSLRQFDAATFIVRACNRLQR